MNTIYVATDLRSGTHYVNVKEIQKKRKKVTNHSEMPLILSPTAADLCPFFVFGRGDNDSFFRNNCTVGFRKLLNDWDFQRIMSRLVGNNRRASAPEITTGHNHCMVDNIVSESNETIGYCIYYIQTQLNASNNEVIYIKIVFSSYYWLKKTNIKM